MHRTRLSGAIGQVHCSSWRGRRADEQRQRCRDGAGELADQPTGNQPRQMASDSNHGLWYGITTGSPLRSRIFPRGSVPPRLIQIAVLTALLGCRRTNFSAAARSDSSRAASPRGPTCCRNLVVDVRRQRLLRLQLPAAEVRRFLGLGVAELVHARRQSRRRCRAAGGGGHAVARAVHDEGAWDRLSSSKPAKAISRFRTSTTSIPTICSWSWARRTASSGPRVRYVFGADLVGSPTLGPTPFMHRESARNNPQVPIGASQPRLDAHQHGRAPLRRRDRADVRSRPRCFAAPSRTRTG